MLKKDHYYKLQPYKDRIIIIKHLYFTHDDLNKCIILKDSEDLIETGIGILFYMESDYTEITELEVFDYLC